MLSSLGFLNSLEAIKQTNNNKKTTPVHIMLPAWNVSFLSISELANMIFHEKKIV